MLHSHAGVAPHVPFSPSPISDRIVSLSHALVYCFGACGTPLHIAADPTSSPSVEILSPQSGFTDAAFLRHPIEVGGKLVLLVHNPPWLAVRSLVSHPPVRRGWSSGFSLFCLLGLA